MPIKDEPAWRQWMRDVGRQHRDLRETLGLSQERLATLAQVSQGAISRLEAGRGLATPLVVVLKVSLAMAAEVRRLDPAVVHPNLLKLVDMLQSLAPPIGGVGMEIAPVVQDDEAREILGLIRRLPERERRQLVTVVRAAAQALQSAAKS